MRDVVSSAVSDRRFTMIVVGTFASIAVFLAAIGIFAVVSSTTLAAAMAGLGAAGIASSLIPAVRSTSIDPMRAIRGE